MYHELRYDRKRLFRALGETVKWPMSQNERNWLRIAIQKAKNEESYLSLSQESAGKVSYGKPNFCWYDTINDKKRIRTTLARFFRRQLKIDQFQISDNLLSDIDSYVFSKTMSNKPAVTLVSGKEISESYKDHIGGSSCMTGNDSNYVKIYEMNPEIVKLVIYRFEGKTARSLLWKTREGETLLDRIYPDDGGKHIPALREWAKNQGFTNRRYNHLPGENGVDVSTGNCLSVELKHNGVFPYFDTFCFSEDGPGNKVILSNENNGGYTFQSTCGEYDEGRHCEECGYSINEDNSYCTDNGTYCESCYSENYTGCHNCGDTVGNDYAFFSEITEGSYCEYCFNDLFTTCEECSCELEISEIEKTTDGEVLCDHCLEKLDYIACDDCGKYSKDTIHVKDLCCDYCENCNDFEKCETCGEYNENSTFDETTESWYCEDCKEEIEKDEENGETIAA